MTSDDDKGPDEATLEGDIGEYLGRNKVAGQEQEAKKRPDMDIRTHGSKSWIWCQ